MEELTTALSLRPASLDGAQPKTVLRCTGEIDVRTVGRLQQALAEAVAASGAELEVDLWEVDYLDSAAIAALLRAYRDLAREQRALTIRAQPPIVDLLRLLRLDQVLDVRSD